MELQETIQQILTRKSEKYWTVEEEQKEHAS